MQKDGGSKGGVPPCCDSMATNGGVVLWSSTSTVRSLPPSFLATRSEQQRRHPACASLPIRLLAWRLLPHHFFPSFSFPVLLLLWFLHEIGRLYGLSTGQNRIPLFSLALASSPVFSGFHFSVARHFPPDAALTFHFRTASAAKTPCEKKKFTVQQSIRHQ